VQSELVRERHKTSLDHGHEVCSLLHLSDSLAQQRPNTFMDISVAAPALFIAAELRADRLGRGQTLNPTGLSLSGRQIQLPIQVGYDLESVGVPVKLVFWQKANSSVQATTSGHIDLTASLKETGLETDVTITAARCRMDVNNVAIIAGSGAMAGPSGISRSSLGGRASSCLLWVAPPVQPAL
jgi:hypothetical protein